MGRVNGGEMIIHAGIDVNRVRHMVREIALKNRFSLIKQTKITTAASELARNALKYADGGICRWSLIEEHDRLGLTLEFEDSGPGIPNLDCALTNGWSSGGGLGLGLPGAKRFTDEFLIDTKVGVGTRMLVTLWR